MRPSDKDYSTDTGNRLFCRVNSQSSYCCIHYHHYHTTTTTHTFTHNMSQRHAHERRGSVLTEFLQTGAGKIPSMEQSGVELTGETTVIGESFG